MPSTPPGQRRSLVCDSGCFFDSGEKAFRTEQFRGLGVPSTPPGQRRSLVCEARVCLCMAESDEGVGSLSRRSERSLAWSAEYPPGQRRSLVCKAVPGRIPGRIAMRHPSRTKNLASVQQEGLTQQEYARCFQGLTQDLF